MPAETDALSEFDFDRVSKSGKYVKFKAGKPLVLRVLTIDPIVKDEVYNEGTDEESISTRFYFIVYNFTESKAQILNATPAMARKIGELHVDPDFGSNIRKIDVKFTPSGEKLERRYDIQVLPKANDLATTQVKECQGLNLDTEIENGQRMSFYKPPEETVASQLEPSPKEKDVVIEDVGDEPINLDDIPF